MKRLKFSDLDFKDNFEHKKAVLFNPDDFQSNTVMQVLCMKPAQTISAHKHNVRTEAFYLLEGVGEIWINDECVVNSKDDVALCQPGDVHKMVNKSDSEELKILIVRTNDPGNEDMIWVKE